MRRLRDKAPEGVLYLYRTTTFITRSNLTQRIYRISAAIDGQVHDMYEFAIRMKPGAGLGDQAVEFLDDEIEVFAGATRYGADITPPEVLSRAMGRTARGGRDLADKLVSRTAEKVTSLLDTLEELERRLAAKADVRAVEAVNDLTERLQRAGDRVTQGPVDRTRFRALSTALTEFNRRAARWPGKVTAAELRAFQRRLDDLLD